MPSRKRTKRHGGAVIEMVVCLPVLAILVLGTIECTTMIFVQQSCQIVGYESMRMAIRGNASNAEAQARATQVIAERKLIDCSAVFSPADIESLDPGTPITITVTVPASSNAMLPLKFFTGNLEAVTIMNKE